MEQAQTLYQETGNPVQLFGAFDYQAESWARPRRIIHKAEITATGQKNARFVVTNLESSQPSFLYKTTRLFCTPTAPRATPLRPISFVFFFIVRRISYCTVWLTRDCRALPG